MKTHAKFHAARDAALERLRAPTKSSRDNLIFWQVKFFVHPERAREMVARLEKLERMCGRGINGYDHENAHKRRRRSRLLRAWSRCTAARIELPGSRTLLRWASRNKPGAEK